MADAPGGAVGSAPVAWRSVGAADIYLITGFSTGAAAVNGVGRSRAAAVGVSACAATSAFVGYARLAYSGGPVGADPVAYRPVASFLTYVHATAGGASSVTGIARFNWRAVGSAAGVATTTATGRWRVPIVGSASGVATVTATGRWLVPIIGSAAGVATTTATPLVKGLSSADATVIGSGSVSYAWDFDSLDPETVYVLNEPRSMFVVNENKSMTITAETRSLLVKSTDRLPSKPRLRRVA